MLITTKIINSIIPVIEVSFSDNISDNDTSITEEGFINFKETWNTLDLENKHYCIKIDTSKLTYAPISYCYKISVFMVEMKSKHSGNLQFSIINIENKLVKSLFNLILRLSKPIATVYVTNKVDTMECLFKYKMTNSILTESFVLINNINVIES
tara:strand:- start:324 stop:785 length:462 start_codon:yes stop_codon:yes gene_type:complete